jgi:eukaryotic-like serine/threonine-protein kinase
VWSPDGKWIAFSSSREGTANLCLRAADGAGRDQLPFKNAEAKRPVDWPRDGKFLLFDVVSPKTAYDIWVLPMAAALANDSNAPNAAQPVPYLRSSADENAARFSPDGRFVAYTSNESGNNAVYVRPFDPNNPTASGSARWQGEGVEWRRLGPLLARRWKGTDIGVTPPLVKYCTLTPSVEYCM